MQTNKFLIFLEKYCLPFGFFLVFALYFISNDKNEMQTSFYLLILAPCLILLPKYRSLIFNNPYIILVILLVVFSAISVLWNNHYDNDMLITASKTALYIIFFFMATGIVLKFDYFLPTFKILSLLLACLILYWYAEKYAFKLPGFHHRYSGSGNLTNPLLAATTYGFFAITCLLGFTQGQYKTKFEFISFLFIFLVLSFALLLTGSRTPIASFMLVSFLLILNSATKYRIHVLILSFSCSTLLIFLLPDTFASFISRGSSGRTEIWSQAISAIKQSPLIGHGLYSEPEIYFKNKLFNSIHNRFLATIYYTGIIGGGLLIGIVALAFWPQPHQSSPIVKYAKYLLLFGCLCSLTQGKNLITRPDMVWLIFWLPVSILIMCKYHHYIAKKDNSLLNQKS